MIKVDENTLVVVTGAAKGNGKAISDALEKANARVIRVDLLKCSEGKDSFIGEVTSNNLIKDVVSHCSKQQYENLVLINNAGVTFPNEYPYPKIDWDKTIAINLSAPFKWIEAFVPLFKRVKSGSIINITSLGAELSFPNNPAYMASKGGLKMLTKYYAKSLGQYGVRANNIGPGYIVTDMTNGSYSNKELKTQRENHTFLGRWGLPSDIADVCLFFCSNESRYITGQDIYVDGGWTTNGLVE
jgi:NAD(P)-dependent dehydrogenase (short-subunit alcohol dehydrogenase family)